MIGIAEWIWARERAETKRKTGPRARRILDWWKRGTHWEDAKRVADELGVDKRERAEWLKKGIPWERLEEWARKETKRPKRKRVRKTPTRPPEETELPPEQPERPAELPTRSQQWAEHLSKLWRDALDSRRDRLPHETVNAAHQALGDAKKLARDDLSNFTFERMWEDMRDEYEFDDNYPEFDLDPYGDT